MHGQDFPAEGEETQIDLQKGWARPEGLAIEQCFPHSEFREGQRECIEYILGKFEEGKQCVILEAPTGSGKSPIGLAVGRFFNSVYYLTIQKVLQSQLVRDFGGAGWLVDLKGRATYPCTYYERYGQKVVNRKGMSQQKLDAILRDGVTCDVGYCREHERSFKSKQCFAAGGSEAGNLADLPVGFEYSTCPYFEQLFRAIHAHTCLMNFSSFLYQTVMTSRFAPRDLIIIDEGHQIEPQLLNFISISLNDLRLQNYGWKLEEFQTAEEYYLYFADTGLMEILARIILDLQEQGEAKDMDEYTGLLRRVRAFMRSIIDREEWVCEFARKEKWNTLKLKPVFAKSKVQPYLLNFGRKALIMSATILDTGIFCRSLGIDRDLVSSYRMRNRFPIEHRPIYTRSAGDLTGGKAKMGAWGPRLVEKFDEVVAIYPGKRGIAHTHSFAIAQLIMSKSKFKGRLLCQTNFKTKEAMLAVHASSSDTVIVAPAMHEGLDLVGDLSRFQIICKIPWPNCFDDKQLDRRVELDPQFYVWITALKLVQSYGRSIRSEDDYADTYVLDGGFYNFIDSRAKSMIPPWFKEAVCRDQGS